MQGEYKKKLPNSLQPTESPHAHEHPVLLAALFITSTVCVITSENRARQPTERIIVSRTDL
jgi:hypothetical protein